MSKPEISADRDVARQWRSWAVEQAILLHGQHGLPTDQLVAEARKILAYVQGDGDGR